MRSKDLAYIVAARAAVASGEARRLRLAARLTQDEIGQRIGANKMTISAYETGRRQPIGRIAREYDRALEELRELVGTES
jgi:DNA-binding XRE family transcriptional regulator